MPPIHPKLRPHLDAVVVLESMWDWESRTSGAGYEQAPAFFRINPENHSGKRLHYLLDGFNFMVTNACKELVRGPNEHGTPDPVWLATNLQKYNYDLLLVCGKVAWETYQNSAYKPSCRVIKMMHPAARTWTVSHLKQYQKLIGMKS